MAVDDDAGCAWTATSNATWLTITSGASGTGNGTVGSALPRRTPRTTARTGTLTDGGQTFTGDAGGRAVRVQHLADVAVDPGGRRRRQRWRSTTTTGCAWTATSNAPWITVTTGASGSGNGTVTYSVAANTGTTSRTGTLTVAGQTFTVTQAAHLRAFNQSDRRRVDFAAAGGTGSRSP